MNVIKDFIFSPVGPMTTHFWGPTMNAGFVVQAFLDKDRAPERISRNMQLSKIISFSYLF